MPPSTFPSIATGRGRPPMGKQVRVAIARCRVRPDVALTLTAWRTTLRVSQGLAVDALVDFAKANNFIPPSTNTHHAKE